MAEVLLILFLLSFISLFFSEDKAYKWAYGLSVSCLATFAYLSTYIPNILAGERIIQHIRWVPAIHFNLNFFLDGLSLFFVLLISFFGFVIFAYAAVYMKAKAHQNRFFFYLALFMSSMMGLVMADNIFLLYVFWELTSISSYFLISYENDQKPARRAGIQALLVTNLGGLALLASLVLLGQQVGSYELSVIVDHNMAYGAAVYLPAAILLFLGCFTKSAQFPFHFWLPNAMAAPTPVSAYLHSATMVKAGVFLLLRMNPVLGGTAFWEHTLIVIGGITALLGAFRSVMESDMKKILAYITVSTLGMLVLAIGVGTTTAIQAALVYLFAHALYKGALFMLAGNVDKQIKSKDVDDLTGLYGVMPYSGTALILSCLAMAGFPPLLAFIAKEKLYEVGLEHGATSFALWAMVLSSVLYVTVSLRLVHGMFLKNRKSRQAETAKEAPLIMWLAPGILSVLGLAFGVFSFAIAPFFEQTAQAANGIPEKLELKLWHGINWALILSILTWAAGVGIYLLLSGFRKTFGRLLAIKCLDFDLWYDRLLKGLSRFSYGITTFVQNGMLTNYLKVSFCVVIALLTYTYVAKDLYPSSWLFQIELRIDRIYELLPAMMLLAGLVVVITSKSRLTMLAALALIGYGVALFYAMFSAADVSMTQFLVETITLLIFIIVLNRLPKHLSFPIERRQYLAIAIALAFGTIFTFILASMQGYHIDSGMKEFYITKTGPEGKGENVVNVVLVDFRAFDTFGEMIVLCMTALGVMTLIKLKSSKEV